MKKAILIAIFCICVPIIALGQPTEGSSSSKDSTRQETNQPVLMVDGTNIFKGNTLLNRSEVLSILNSSPAIASQYVTCSHSSVYEQINMINRKHKQS